MANLVKHTHPTHIVGIFSTTAMLFKIDLMQIYNGCIATTFFRSLKQAFVFFY